MHDAGIYALRACDLVSDVISSNRTTAQAWHAPLDVMSSMLAGLRAAPGGCQLPARPTSSGSPHVQPQSTPTHTWVAWRGWLQVIHTRRCWAC